MCWRSPFVLVASTPAKLYSSDLAWLEALRRFGDPNGKTHYVTKNYDTALMLAADKARIAAFS
jgi:hypothetical protein